MIFLDSEAIGTLDVIVSPGPRGDGTFLPELIPLNGTIFFTPDDLDSKRTDLSFRVQQGVLIGSNIARGSGGSKLLKPPYIASGTFMKKYTRIMGKSIPLLGSP